MTWRRLLLLHGPFWHCDSNLVFDQSTIKGITTEVTEEWMQQIDKKLVYFSSSCCKCIVLHLVLASIVYVKVLASKSLQTEQFIVSVRSGLSVGCQDTKVAKVIHENTFCIRVPHQFNASTTERRTVLMIAVLAIIILTRAVKTVLFSHCWNTSLWQEAKEVWYKVLSFRQVQRQGVPHVLQTSNLVIHIFGFVKTLDSQHPASHGRC